MSAVPEKIKISVIIPIYNSGRYLAECLDTVLSQTLKEIEVLCPTNEQENVILRYAQKDERIKIITQKSQCIAEARNSALCSAQGEFVAFMEPNDRYPEKNTLEKLYSAAIEHNVNICGGSLTEYKGGELIRQFSGYKKKSVFEEERSYSFSDYQYDEYYERFIYSLDFLRKNGIRFPCYVTNEKTVFCAKAMAKAGEFYALPDATYESVCEFRSTVWDNTTIFHLLCGFRDNIKLSVENEFNILYAECIKRLRNSLKSIENKIETFSDEIIMVLFEICTLINGDMQDEFQGCLDEIYTIADAAYKIRKLKNGEFVAEFEDMASSLKSRVSYKEKYASDYIEKAYEKIILKKYDNETQAVKIAAFDKTPDISVIVPVYNVEDYLAHCLDSLVAQTFENYEIICVNDGSTDGSLKILEEYCEKYHNISVYSHTNMGLSETRNRGVRVAKGKYIYFADSDDMLENDALGMLFERAEKDKLDVLFFDAVSFCENDKSKNQINTYKDYYKRKGEYGDRVYTGAEFMSALEKNNEYRTSVCLQFISKEFFDNNSFEFARGIIHEDNLFTYICLLSARRVGYIRRCFYNRRVHEDSIMTSKKSFFNVYGYFHGYMKMNEFLEANPALRNNKDALNIIYRQFEYLKSIFEKLDSREQLSYLVLDDYTKNLFRIYVLNPVKSRLEKEKINNELKKVWKEKSEINSKLKNAYLQKSDINRKLQVAYEEKSEINKKLKTAYEEKSEINKKLKIAYEEKSEINKKLHTTYAQKSEINKELHKANEEKNLMKKEIKELNRNIRKKESDIATKNAQIERLNQENARIRYNIKHPLRYIIKKILKALNIKK